MHLALGTLAVLYYFVFLYIFYTINYASRMQQATKVLVATPAILFVTLFPYFLEDTLFTKFLLTIIGFFTSLNIVDLVFLEPVEHMTFKEYMFYLSTSSRAESPSKSKIQAGDKVLESPGVVNMKGLWRLGKAAGKFLILCVVLESIQKWDYKSTHVEYYIFMYLVGLCLYLMFNVLLDTVGLFWEFVYDMKPKELFNAPFMASSPRDFWSRRWNMFFRDFFHKIFFKNRKSISYLRSMLSALAIFAISGVMHEYVYWAIMGTFTGRNMMFFMVHGIATTGQAIFQLLVPSSKRAVPIWLAIPLNTVFLALTFPLFIDPYVQSGFIHNVRLPFTLMPKLNAAVTGLSSYYT